jgi:hypothetical protein
VPPLAIETAAPRSGRIAERPDVVGTFFPARRLIPAKVTEVAIAEE